MMLRNKYKKRINKGFTLLEMMIVVGIVLVLSAVAIGIIPNLKTKLHQSQLDKNAETLFTAAQSRLTQLRISGRESMYKSADGIFADTYWPANIEASPADPEDDVEFIRGQMGYVLANSDSAKAAASALFPSSITDTSVWSGYWVIEYNYISGTVFGVFFSDEPFTYNSNSFNALRGTVKDNGFETRLAGVSGVCKGSTIGYYGQGSARINNEKYTLKVEIVNAEVLYAKVWVLNSKDEPVNPFSAPGAPEFSYFLSQPGVNPTTPVTLSQTNWSSSGQYLVIVLDELSGGAAVDGSSCKAVAFKDLIGTSGLKPGMDTVINFLANGGTAKYYGTSESDVSRTFNSLFAKVETNEKDETKYVAYIACGRHLQNLSVSASNVTNTITSAVVTGDKDTGLISFKRESANTKNWAKKNWYDIYTNKNFSPIYNDNIVSLTGEKKDDELPVIEYITIKSSNNTGLFTTFKGTTISDLCFDHGSAESTGNHAALLCGKITTSSPVINNIKVTNSSVTAVKNAGIICGQNDKAFTARNLSFENDTVLSTGSGSSGCAGLLTGYGNAVTTGNTADGYITVINSSVKSVNSIAGTLAGSVYGEMAITKVKLESPVINGKNNAGGLVGQTVGMLSISDIFITAPDITGGNNAGGLCGNLTPDINNAGKTTTAKTVTIEIGTGATAKITGGVCSGGFFGSSKGNLTISGVNKISGVVIAGTNNTSRAGGLVGESNVNENASSIKLTINDGPVIQGTKVAAGQYAGGIVGSSFTELTVEYAKLKKIDGTTSYSEVGSNTYAGGIVGYSTAKATVDYCEVTDCKIVGDEFAGGIIAKTIGELALSGDKVYITDIPSSMSDITKFDRYISGKECGGLVGTVDNATTNISQSFAAAVVGSNSAAKSGGLIGQVKYTQPVTVESSYADCYVLAGSSGDNYASGLIGYADQYDVTITGCYSAGYLYSANRMAGIACSNGGSIKGGYCYAATKPLDASKYYATVSGSNNTTMYYFQASSASFAGANNGSAMLGIDLLSALNAGGERFMYDESVLLNDTESKYTTPYNLLNQGLKYSNYDFPRIKIGNDMLHHYGDWYMDEYSALIEITNGEVLYAKVTIYNKAGTKYSGIDPSVMSYTLKQDANYGRSVTGSFTGVTPDGDGKFTLILDKLHDGAAGTTADSARQFKEIVGSKLTPGLATKLEIKITHAVVKDYAGTQKTFNSLFADNSSSTAANITCGRHLQNLSTAVSSVGTTITTAYLKNDISFASGSPWYKAYSTRAFKPIINTALKNFEGANKSIVSLNVTTSSSSGRDNAGLFDKVISGTVQNLALESPVIAANAGSAGALAGYIQSATIRNITAKNVSVTGKTASGGLIGKTLGTCTVKGSKVYHTSTTQKDTLDQLSAYIKGGSSCGGLVGIIGGTTTVYTTTVSESFAASVVGVSGTTNAGGLIGYVESKGAVKVTSSYGDSYVFGAYASGLIGSVNSNGTASVTGCSAAGYLKGTTGMAGLVYGKISSGGCSYTIASPYKSDTFYSTAVSAPDAVKSTLYYGNKSYYSAKNLGYCMLGEEASELCAVLNAGGTYFTESGSYTPYNMLKQGLTKYPYPLVNGLAQYGDWATVAPLGLVYYEIYSDGTYGVYTRYQNGRTTTKEHSTLKNDLNIVGDGYGIYFPNYKNSGDFSAKVTVGAYNGSSWDMEAPSFSHQYTRVCTLTPNSTCSTTSYSGGTKYTDFSRIAVGKDGKVKTFGTDCDIIISLDMVTTDRYYGNNYVVYKKLAVEYSDKNTTTGVSEEGIYASTLFAKDISVTDPYAGAASESAAMSGKKVLIRTARQLGLLGHNYSQFSSGSDSGKGIDGISNITFVLDHDIDWTSYAWSFFSYEPGNPRSMDNSNFDWSKVDASASGTYVVVPNIWPIGVKDPGFIGTFDGQNHTITNMSVSYHDGIYGEEYVGLFGRVGGAGTVKNLKLINLHSSGSSDNTHKYSGALTGLNSGKIDNVVLACKYGQNQTFFSPSLYHGGFVGQNTGTITKCSVSGYTMENSITGHAYSGNTTMFMGGFVGRNTGNISYCEANIPYMYRNGTLTTKNYIGGFAGENTGTVSYCYCLSTIKTDAFNSDDCLAGFSASGSGNYSYCYCISSCLSSQGWSNDRWSQFAPSGTASNCQYLHQTGLWYYGKQYDVFGDAKRNNAGLVSGVSKITNIANLNVSGFTKTSTIIFGNYTRTNIPTVMRENGDGAYVHYGDFPATQNSNVSGGSVKAAITPAATLSVSKLSAMPKMAARMLYAAVQDSNGNDTTEEYDILVKSENDGITVTEAESKAYDTELGMTVEEATNPETGVYPNAVAFMLLSSDDEGVAELTVSAEKKEEVLQPEPEAVEETPEAEIIDAASSEAKAEPTGSELEEEEKSGISGFFNSLFSAPMTFAAAPGAESEEEAVTEELNPEPVTFEITVTEEEEKASSVIPEADANTRTEKPEKKLDKPTDHNGISGSHLGFVDYNRKATTATSYSDLVADSSSETKTYPVEDSDYGTYDLPVATTFDANTTDILLYVTDPDTDVRYEITEVKVVKQVEREIEDDEQQEQAETPAPTATPKVSEAPKASETPKPSESVKPVETAKPEAAEKQEKTETEEQDKSLLVKIVEAIFGKSSNEEEKPEASPAAKAEALSAEPEKKPEASPTVTAAPAKADEKTAAPEETAAAEEKTEEETEEKNTETIEVEYLIYSKAENVLWDYTDYYVIMTDPVVMHTDSGAIMYRPISFYMVVDSEEPDPDAVLYVTVQHGEETYVLKYQPSHRTLYFDANGGEGEMENQAVSGIEIAKLNSCSYTREGYTFAGWSTSVGGPVEFYDGQLIGRLRDDLHLHAVWKRDVVTESTPEATPTPTPESTPSPTPEATPTPGTSPEVSAQPTAPQESPAN